MSFNEIQWRLESTGPISVYDPKRTGKSSSFLPPDKNYFYSEHFIRIRKGDIESQDVCIRSKSFCCERIIFSNKVNELSKNWKLSQLRVSKQKSLNGYKQGK